MSQSIKEEWMMRAIPIEEVAEMVWMRQVRDEGREEGIEKGREEGMEKGIEKGREEGMGKGMQAVARSMRDEGLSVEIIMKCTGLSESEILQI
jgi:predicted transposase/invertase (TIGR01784 family)